MQAENIVLFNKLHDLQQIIWILTGLVIFCFILLSIATVILGINRKRMRKMHRLYTKRFEHLNQRVVDKDALCVGIVEHLKKHSESTNANQSESHGGNMKGGHQTVNINTGESQKNAIDFQEVLLNQIAENRRSDITKYNILQLANDLQAEQIKTLKEALDKSCNQKTQPNYNEARERPKRNVHTGRKKT